MYTETQIQYWTNDIERMIPFMTDRCLSLTQYTWLVVTGNKLILSQDAELEGVHQCLVNMVNCGHVDKNSIKIRCDSHISDQGRLKQYRVAMFDIPNLEGTVAYAMEKILRKKSPLWTCEILAEFGKGTYGIEIMKYTPF